MKLKNKCANMKIVLVLPRITGIPELLAVPHKVAPTLIQFIAILVSGFVL